MHGSNVRIHGEDRVLSFIVPVFHDGPDMDSEGDAGQKDVRHGSTRTIRASTPLRVTIISPNRPYVTGKTYLAILLFAVPAETTVLRRATREISELLSPLINGAPSVKYRWNQSFLKSQRIYCSFRNLISNQKLPSFFIMYIPIKNFD